jgi:glycerol-3-phosphate cytidylyltransferase
MKERVELTWWIGVGTALGYAREQDFIAGNTDIDVRIGLDFRDEAAAVAMAAEVVRRFEDDGFRLIREMYWDRRPMQTAFIDTRNHDVVFDVFYFYTSYTAGCYVNFNDIGSREKPEHLIENLERSHWPGRPDITVYLPSPIEEYNRWRWGPEWRVPKKNSELDRELDLRCIKDLPSEYTVLVYGTFDLFHDGHVKLLERAAALGDRLVVGVVSDELLYRKGKRNAYTQEQRLDIVGALRCVDRVFLQRDLDQKEYDIERFDASYLVFGDDWTGHPRVEQVRGYRGVEIVYLSRTPGVSSTALHKRVRDATLVEAYESIGAYRTALDPGVDYTVRELGDDTASLGVEAALSNPQADKVVLFQDRVSKKGYAFLFELVCDGTIVIDLNRLEVYKKVGVFDHRGVSPGRPSDPKRLFRRACSSARDERCSAAPGGSGLSPPADSAPSRMRAAFVAMNVAAMTSWAVRPNVTTPWFLSRATRGDRPCCCWYRSTSRSSSRPSSSPGSA